MRGWSWLIWPFPSPRGLWTEQTGQKYLYYNVIMVCLHVFEWIWIFQNFKLLMSEKQHVFYPLPVFLLSQVEYSSSGEESLLSSSMSSGRSVSSLCSCRKIAHGNESSRLLRNRVIKQQRGKKYSDDANYESLRVNVSQGTLNEYWETIVTINSYLLLKRFFTIDLYVYKLRTKSLTTMSYQQRSFFDTKRWGNTPLCWQ